MSLHLFSRHSGMLDNSSSPTAPETIELRILDHLIGYAQHLVVSGHQHQYQSVTLTDLGYKFLHIRPRLLTGLRLDLLVEPGLANLTLFLSDDRGLLLTARCQRDWDALPP